MKSHIQVPYVEASPVLRSVPGVYQFTPTAKWPWLQKVLLFGLKLLGACYWNYQTHYEVLTLNVDNVSRAITRLANDIDMRTGERPKAFLVGYKTLEIFKDEMVRDIHCRFELDTHHNKWPVFRGITLLTTHYFPEGIVPLPNL